MKNMNAEWCDARETRVAVSPRRAGTGPTEVPDLNISIQGVLALLGQGRTALARAARPCLTAA